MDKIEKTWYLLVKGRSTIEEISRIVMKGGIQYTSQ